MKSTISQKDVKVELKDLTQGFNKSSPLGFISEALAIRYQTTEKSHDGTPRYSVTLSTDSTYYIGEMTKSETWTPLYTFRELFLVQKMAKMKKDVMSAKELKQKELNKLIADWKIESAFYQKVSKDMLGSADRLISLNKEIHELSGELGLKIRDLNLNLKKD